MNATPQPESNQAEVLRDLRRIPNVGPATASDLYNLGIRTLSDLKTEKPLDLYTRLGELKGSRQDPCVYDTLVAVVDFATPWWHFSRQRRASGSPDLASNTHPSVMFPTEPHRISLTPPRGKVPTRREMDNWLGGRHIDFESDLYPRNSQVNHETPS